MPLPSVDTNVVVRLLVNDDVARQQRAFDRLRRVREAGERALVSSVVLAEVSWVLDSVYGYERAQIASALGAVVATSPLMVKDRAAVARAIDAYSTGRADFADYLVLEEARAADALPLLTFDRALHRHEGCAAP